MPPGAEGVSTCGCGNGCAGNGASGSPLRSRFSPNDPMTLELAAVERIAPAAPYAPRRNISLRFNDTHTLPNEADCLSFKGLTADNPNVHVPSFIARDQRLAAGFTDLQRLAPFGGRC